MVNVGHKSATRRQAIAAARLRMSDSTRQLLLAGNMPKGDVLAAARIAGIMAAKRTPELIPLCHTIPLTAVEIHFQWDEQSGEGSGEALLEIQSVVETVDRTGVEMEALVAVSIAALTIYDMCKAVDREMRIETTRLLKKSGGRSGTFIAPDWATNKADQEEVGQ